VGGSCEDEKRWVKHVCEEAWRQKLVRYAEEAAHAWTDEVGLGANRAVKQPAGHNQQRIQLWVRRG
jgi:hypothetical protein